MRVLLTGMNGTVAPAMAAELERQGHTVIPWDRTTMPNGSLQQTEEVIRESRAEAVMHFATGPVQWAEWIAQVCAESNLPHLHTSSVSVFGSHQKGPFSVEDIPEPDDDYGRYKLEGEQRVLAANPSAHVFRIGWQIGDAPGSNNMIDYFHREAKDGVLQVSRHWYPASSYLLDTARCLLSTLQGSPPGLYHVDANPGLSMVDIAAREASRLGLPWQIEPVDGLVRDHRMVDPRVEINRWENP